MTPKEKANKLANKFITKSVFDMTDEELKQQRKQGKTFAIICVDEILEIIRYHGTDIGKHSLKYWLDVKNQISLL
jgi:hypothetical protein